MDNRLIFLSRLATFDDGVTQKDKEIHLMDVVDDERKPVPVGKSAGAFNGQTRLVALRPTSLRFHAARKNL